MELYNPFIDEHDVDRQGVWGVWGVWGREKEKDLKDERAKVTEVKCMLQN